MQDVDDLIMEGLGSGLIRSPFRGLRELKPSLAQRKSKLFTNGFDRKHRVGAAALQLSEPQRHLVMGFDHR